MNEKEAYIFGLLLGDSTILSKQYKDDFIFFSNVHQEISELVKSYCIEKNLKYISFTRKPQEENWSDLHCVEIYSTDLINYLKDLKLVDNEYNYHLINNPHLIRGFFETSATFFEFADKKITRHRIAFSGTKNILVELQNIIHPFSICTPIVQRKEREHLGISSKSYRFTINRRSSKVNLLNWIYSDDSFGSNLYIKKIEYYRDFIIKNPINIYNEYKHHKYATKAMCEHLGLFAEGKRGGTGGGSGDKPIEIKEKQTLLNICYGWEDTFKFVSEIYKTKTLLEPPKINEFKIRGNND
jgi:hypothetical protein